MADSVFRVVVNTEDFSQDDIRLMCQYGEPEVNVGGTIQYVYGDTPGSVPLGDQLIRVLHGFPFAMGFDSRDYENGVGEAMAAGIAWKESVRERIAIKMSDLREMAKALPTEEVYDNI